MIQFKRLIVKPGYRAVEVEYHPKTIDSGINRKPKPDTALIILSGVTVAVMYLALAYFSGYSLWY